MFPAQRLGRILGALLGEGRPRTIRGAACRQTAGRRPSKTVPPGAGHTLMGTLGLLRQLGRVVAGVRTAGTTGADRRSLLSTGRGWAVQARRSRPAQLRAAALAGRRPRPVGMRRPRRSTSPDHHGGAADRQVGTAGRDRVPADRLRPPGQVTERHVPEPPEAGEGGAEMIAAPAGAGVAGPVCRGSRSWSTDSGGRGSRRPTRGAPGLRELDE
jgi:hypothetical protein